MRLVTVGRSGTIELSALAARHRANAKQNNHDHDPVRQLAPHIPDVHRTGLARGHRLQSVGGGMIITSTVEFLVRIKETSRDCIIQKSCLSGLIDELMKIVGDKSKDKGAIAHRVCRPAA